MTTRLEVNTNDETADALRSLSAEAGVPVTEIVRRSVGLYETLSDRQGRGDRVEIVKRAPWWRGGGVVGRTRLRLLSGSSGA